ncbi:hypothetical protein EC988_000212 [Linderina pennispora]|nr:hypothetical protein EC988_000212 [Linderina pennispora]
MEEFRQTVESRVVSLSALDSYASVINTQVILFYKNESVTPDFMPAHQLEEGFYKTLKQFPTLAGYLRQKPDNGLEIVIDKDDLNLPEYRESTSDIRFDSLDVAKFNPSVWPEGLMSAGVVPVPSGSSDRIKLANVHIVRLKDNSGVAMFISVIHAIGDGTGFYVFVNRWAEETRCLHSGEAVSVANYCMDRSAIQANLPDTRKPLNAATKLTFTEPFRMAEWMAWLSLNTRNKLMDRVITGAGWQGSLYKINRAKLDSLCTEVSKHIPDGERISNNDVLSALIAKTLAQSEQSAATHLSGAMSWLLGKQNMQKVSIACDSRMRLGISHLNYVGNAQFLPAFSVPIEQSESPTTPGSLAEIARLVREVVNSADAEHIASYFDTLYNEPSSYTRPFIASTLFKSTVTITSQSRFGLYSADFGRGAPAFATTRPNRVAEAVSILPDRPPSKDLYVSFTNTAQMLELIRNNRFWSDFAEFVY